MHSTSYDTDQKRSPMACPNCHNKHLPHGDEIWTLSCHATRPCGCRNKHGTICSRLYNMLICILDMYYVYCKYNGYMYTICCICTNTNYIVYNTKYIYIYMCIVNKISMYINTLDILPLYTDYIYIVNTIKYRTYYIQNTPKTRWHEPLP